MFQTIYHHILMGLTKISYNKYPLFFQYNQKFYNFQGSDYATLITMIHDNQLLPGACNKKWIGRICEKREVKNVQKERDIKRRNNSWNRGSPERGCGRRISKTNGRNNSGSL